MMDNHRKLLLYNVLYRQPETKYQGYTITRVTNISGPDFLVQLGT